MESGKNYRSELGHRGEDIACSLLESMGPQSWKETGEAGIWKSTSFPLPSMEYIL